MPQHPASWKSDINLVQTLANYKNYMLCDNELKHLVKVVADAQSTPDDRTASILIRHGEVLTLSDPTDIADPK
jgi:hypothetical protein